MYRLGYMKVIFTLTPGGVYKGELVAGVDYSIFAIAFLNFT